MFSKSLISLISSIVFKLTYGCTLDKETCKCDAGINKMSCTVTYNNFKTLDFTRLDYKYKTHKQQSLQRHKARPK